MANQFFNASGSPGVGSVGLASIIRSEFANIEAGFDKFPAFVADAWLIGDALGQGVGTIHGDVADWTPTLTAETAGNLNVVYSTRVAKYIRVGRYNLLTGRIVTSTFTHTTASGEVRITGVPVTQQSRIYDAQLGHVHVGGFTVSGSTQYSAVVGNNRIAIQAISAGTSGISNMVITAFPTSVNVDLRFCVEFFATTD